MKLHVKKLGQGAPILILHGFLGTSDNWITIGRELSKNYLVYLIDQRNHGLSPKTEAFTYSLMADDLHELIEEEQIQNPVIIGHSMGGKTAMKYSTLFPNAFKGLIIVDIAPRYYPVHHQKILEGLLSIHMETLQSRGDADKQLSNYVSEPGIRQFLLKNLNRTKSGFEWKANLPVLNRDIEHVGVEITGHHITEKPVHFIRGDRSDYIKNTDREAIKNMYPNAQILTIKGAGHWVHAEQQEPFLKTITYILQSLF